MGNGCNIYPVESQSQESTKGYDDSGDIWKQMQKLLTGYPPTPI